MSDSGLAGPWSDRLRELAEQEGVPGAALGIWADGREYLTADGVLNAATGVPVTPDSLFQVGSITKLWTGTMIMQLAQEGRLTLDTTVAGLLPGVRLGIPDVSAEVTIRHLLTHSSGIDGDIFTDTGRGGECIERYSGGLARAPRIFPPGAAYSYCNSGFVLLGRIIEVLDGREWDASLRGRLVRPLGLAQTVTLPEEAILHRGGRAPPVSEPARAGLGLGNAAQPGPRGPDHRERSRCADVRAAASRRWRRSGRNLAAEPGTRDRDAAAATTNPGPGRPGGRDRAALADEALEWRRAGHRA
jgi:CubicO group peptidase (beta-lactamase class C family)